MCDSGVLLVWKDAGAVRKKSVKVHEEMSNIYSSNTQVYLLSATATCPPAPKQQLEISRSLLQKASPPLSHFF